MTGWWRWFERFLDTDPRDVGGDEAIAILHIFVELLASGTDAANRYPEVSVHLAACGSRSDITLGLLSAVQADELDS